MNKVRVYPIFPSLVAIAKVYPSIFKTKDILSKVVFNDPSTKETKNLGTTMAISKHCNKQRPINVFSFVLIVTERYITNNIMACSTTAVHLTVNQRVAGSNPATPVSSNSSAVEHLIYIQVVGGSIPSSSICIFYHATITRDQT